MKKFFLIAGITMITATVTFAHNASNRKEVKNERTDGEKETRTKQRVKNNNLVSGLTKLRFANDFPDATNVEFVKTKNFDEVHFVSGKQILKAFYDYDNNLVGTTEKINFADLPENAQKKIQQKYAGYNISDVVKFRDNEENDTDMIVFETVFDDQDNYFVELEKPGSTIVVRVNVSGNVSFFTNIRPGFVVGI